MNTLYHYDPANGAFLRESGARLDPIDHMPMVPAYATLVPPPQTTAHQVAIWDGGAWHIEDDYRGTEYWLPDGTHAVITEIGIAPPPDAMDAPPPPLLADLQAAAILQVIGFATARRAALAEGADRFKLTGYTSKADRVRRYLAGSATADDLHLIDLEIDRRGRGETREELIGKQGAKAALFEAASVIIDGMESAALAAIEATETEAALTQLLLDLETTANAEFANLTGGTYA